MSNLTLNIDDDTLRRARVRALEEGTTVNAIVRSYLEEFADADRHVRAMARILELAEASDASSGHDGRTWTRDDAYDI
jgi:plasmid stability protein